MFPLWVRVRGALGSDNEYSALAAEPAPYIGFAAPKHACPVGQSSRPPRLVEQHLRLVAALRGPRALEVAAAQMRADGEIRSPA